MYSTSQTSIDSVYRVGARLDIFELGNGTKVVRFIPYTRSIVRNVSFFKEKCLSLLSRLTPNLTNWAFTTISWLIETRLKKSKLENFLFSYHEKNF